MKKISFLFALLCASVMGWASTQYCGETSPNANFTFSLMNVSGNTYKIQFDAVGDVKFGGAAVNVNCGVNQTAGAGIFFGGDNAANWVFTDDCAYLEFATASESSVPTGFYGNYFCFSKKGGDIIVIEGFNPSDVDWTATCAAVEDNEKPVMGDVSLVKAGGNYAIINVAATDNVGVVKYRAIDLSKEFDGQFTPKDGKITVTGLTPSTAYYLLIYALDAAGNQSELANAVSVTTAAYYTEPQTAATAPTWPAVQVKALYSPTYNNADYNHQDWGSGTVYTQDTYGKKYVTNNNGFFGADGFNHNCIAMEKLHYDIWIADDASLRIVPICRNDADSGNEPEVGKVVNLTGQQWNSIDLDLATDYSAVTNWKHVYQVKIDNAKNLTFWVGNAYFYTTVDPTADIQKPTDVTTAVASTDYFSVTLTVSATDNSGAVSYVVKNGETEVATGGGASGESATITVKNLTPATAYTFSVIASDAAGNEADPVAVPTATTTALPAAAPDPTAAAANVKSIYSDSYEAATTVSNYCENWWQAPTLLQTTLGEGDNVLYYTAGAAGNNVFGWSMGSYDFSGFQKLHLSVYPLAATTVEVYPVIQPEAEYHKVSETLVANQWNDVVFDYTEKTFTAMTQLGFVLPHTAVAYFIDNVYFFKEEGGSAIDNAVETMKAQKLIENGQLIIIKNGIRYNVAGQIVK